MHAFRGLLPLEELLLISDTHLMSGTLQRGPIMHEGRLVLAEFWLLGYAGEPMRLAHAVHACPYRWIW